MKNAAMIIVSAIMGFLILGIVLMIGGSMNRRCEVETILPSAMEKTVEGMPFAEAGVFRRIGDCGVWNFWRRKSIQTLMWF